jgi:hypothetical protein
VFEKITSLKILSYIPNAQIKDQVCSAIQLAISSKHQLLLSHIAIALLKVMYYKIVKIGSINNIDYAKYESFASEIYQTLLTKESDYVFFTTLSVIFQVLFLIEE